MKYILIFIILPCVIYAFISNIAGPPIQDHSVSAQGRFLCKGKPFSKVEVELRDFYVSVFPKHMNTSYPDENGFFKISGTLNQRDPIHPYLTITHRCRGQRFWCKNTFNREIPKDYIRFGNDKPPLFDLKTMELNDPRYTEYNFCRYHSPN